MASDFTRRDLFAGAALLGASRLGAQAPSNHPSGAPLKVLILTGSLDLPWHHWRASTEFLRGVLERTGRFEVKVLEEVRGVTATTLAGFDVLVLNYNGPRWGAATEQAIEEFVKSGKGFVSFHGTTYGSFYGMVSDGKWKASPNGDLGWAAYPELTGAKWDPPKIGHGERHLFRVKWTDPEHPVSAGLPSGFEANDELYHQLTLLPSTHVLATAFDDPKTGGTGREEPIIWCGPFGRGRTFHITLGHDLSALQQSGFLTAFARGCEWAASGKVTLPAAITVDDHLRKPVRLLVSTGGHGYPSSFYSLFEGYDDITWHHATSLKETYQPDIAKHFDVLVLHDMYDEIGEPERANLRAFLEAGKGVVSTHHSIVDYTGWPWFHEEVIGGKYFVKAAEGHPASAFKEGVEFVAAPTKLGRQHPVTRGIGPIPAHDEVYRGMWHSPSIQVLMETEHALNDRPVVYVGPNPKMRAIYIQMGHSASTHRHPAYRKLVRNAALWCANSEYLPV